MALVQDSADHLASITSDLLNKPILRSQLRAQASRLALLSAVGFAAAMGASLMTPQQAQAACVVVGADVVCDNTVTTDTTSPANPPVDRNYTNASAVAATLTVSPGAAVSGNGLAVSNTGAGGVTVTNNGTITVDAGNTPIAGGTAALSVTATGGPVVYTGGAISNNGVGNGFNVLQNGAGPVTLTITGPVTAATGEGVTVRDTAAGGDISVTTGAVTALTVGRDGIDVQTNSATADVTVVANGAIQAGNAGIVAALINAGGAGDVNVTANGTIDARFGIDAENFGAGSTTVTTVGAVNATSGNGIFALTSGGAVTGPVIVRVTGPAPF